MEFLNKVFSVIKSKPKASISIFGTAMMMAGYNVPPEATALLNAVFTF
jgi:hypothetical protein